MPVGFGVVGVAAGAPCIDLGHERGGVGNASVKALSGQNIDQIRAGGLYARANLAASAVGLAMHPVSQALQEYPEMDVEYQALHRRLNVVEPQRIQMLARVGYAPAVAPAARWGLEAKLRT